MHYSCYVLTCLSFPAQVSLFVLYPKAVCKNSWVGVDGKSEPTSFLVTFVPDKLGKWLTGNYCFYQRKSCFPLCVKGPKWIRQAVFFFPLWSASATESKVQHLDTFQSLRKTFILPWYIIHALFMWLICLAPIKTTVCLPFILWISEYCFVIVELKKNKKTNKLKNSV